jgi:2-dehydro-3-deoxyphosphogluconate aldolase/(4S)-4-hydroxy-2-oxoglutarate aldolase
MQDSLYVQKIREEWLGLIQQHRAIAVIRAPEFAIGQKMAKAVAKGGVRLIEITWNSDRPFDLVPALQRELPDCLIGAGTLLDHTATGAAIASGAKFLFSPHTHPALIQMALSAAIPVIPGALTPTEIVLAWNAGASSVKVFPIQSMGGIHYLKQLAPPLQAIPLIPTGGVTVENAADFIQAGAVGVGLSGDLFPPRAIAQQEWDAITQRAADLLARLNRVAGQRNN